MKVKAVNFVIFGTDADFFTPFTDAFLQMPNVVYNQGRIHVSSSIIRLIYKLHMSTQLNRVVKLPFKSIWNGLYYRNEFLDMHNLCFLFFANRYWMCDVNYPAYLKRHYPGCKLVIMFNDVVDKYFERFPSFSIDYVRKNFDLVLTYNKLDEAKYGFQYYPTFWSRIPVNENTKFPESDILYVGAAKDRLGQLLSCYGFFIEHGLKCDFHITGVPQNKQKYADRISYNKPISYNEVLERVQRTKCVLEISQQGALGFTPRTMEAILYNKKLISNNPILIGTKFYNKNYVFYFSQIDDIDIEMIKKIDKVDFGYNGEYSPDKLLKFIEEVL
ncbi:MAG: hypothetical protein GX612_08285 [Bacteroidales bacterium]|nr:hypothetical protein [Bacteroidales bacterium]